MNHPPPLNETHATGVPPLYLTPTEVGDTPTAKNTKRTQSPYGHGMPCPHFAKRTQFHKANWQKPTANSQNMRNEPNLTPANLRNEPNSRIPSVPTHPKNTKRTQFTVPLKSRRHSDPTLRETNPIYRTAGVSPAFQSPIMRNEPNLPYRWRLAGIPIPHYAKRTQFTVPLASPRHSNPPSCETNPIYRTAGVSPAFRSPITRNEPNLNKSEPTLSPYGISS